jgi:uncharacterized protein (DUF2249 family)
LRKEVGDRVWSDDGNHVVSKSMSVQSQNAMTYDVRKLPPAKQQAAVLSMFDGLRPSQTFTFVCDFNPMALERKFAAFFDGEHSWTCIWQGPSEWRIEVGKLAQVTAW